MAKREEDKRGCVGWWTVPLRGVVALFAGLIVLFGMPWTALWVFVGAFRQWWTVRAVWLGVGAWFWYLPFHEYQDRIDDLSTRIEQGPSAYSVRDKLGIWGLNLVMAVAGIPVSPEAALETTLLALPGGPPQRGFTSDFAMGSPRIREAVAALKDGGTRRVSWDAYTDDLRVALALNAADVTVERSGDNLLCSATVEVSYAQRYFVEFFTVRGRAIGVEEGLYAMLQDAGWLHPYTATWAWVVNVNDV